jgi:hypothetical protein
LLRRDWKPLQQAQFRDFAEEASGGSRADGLVNMLAIRRGIVFQVS